MRDTYGKMMFILQDTQTNLIKSETGLSFVKKILTVHTFLEDRGGLPLLGDPVLEAATMCIENANNDKSKSQLQNESMMKAEASQLLVRKYSSGDYCYCYCYSI